VTLRRARPACVLATLVLLALAGCGRRHPLRPFPAGVQAATSDSGAVPLFQYCWNHRDEARYVALFTGDFQFVYPPDSIGGRWAAIGEPEMLRIAHAMFVGGGVEPPITNVSLQMLPGHSYPDTRPGRDPRIHREIRAAVDLTVTADSQYRITGYARFHLVRGDSAVLPDTLLRLGIRADSTHWFIDEWDDETNGTPASRPARPANAMPVRTATWASILSLYRGPLGAPGR
jgi:predicted small lipoprotein YifL